ncbi:xanthine dehydrogenase family protein molybdopterin-binding subunit [Roseateles sp. DAIF2]|uniref:xanthine dehydrogenase family protein molybdopterin-binding subunit n=1 Tax=Roseateles sp. DAIF2 TaxID=2714952 RepID=UPI0018A32EC1|nr:molybdopterin cofactor-binding domain-containing protein [Roseateles sp. DAIF2]QPF75987.1 xanthine dehydrogenase family protein molybdopterin-binding subunit [Roseateles sp. DAIF2]
MKRRTLLLSGLAGGGALLVGAAALPPRGRLGRANTLPAAPGELGLNAWIKIDAASGDALLAMPRSEMGQGVHTALAQLVAEELHLPLARVRLIPAGHESLYGNVAMFVGQLPLAPQHLEPGRESRLARIAQWSVAKLARELGVNATGGSSSIADAWEPLRWAAATARQQLLGAAALRWQQSIEELKLEDGWISHAIGQRAHYGELAQAAAATPPGAVALTPPAAWRLIGRPAPRSDLPAKVDGSARFGIDQRPPGLLYAAVRHAPMLGGAPGAVDERAAMGLPDVLRLVRLPPYAGSQPALAVVARNSWRALQAVRALDVQWQGRPAGALDGEGIAAALREGARRAAAEGLAFRSAGDAAAALAEPGGRRVEALYEAPYLAHATLEPMNCTAQVRGGRVTIWAPTQVSGLARALAARVAGVEEEAVTVHVTYLGGGFGRRLEVDVVGQAVRVALETGGAPVQLLWSREEDMAHDFYRPAGAAFCEARLDEQGRPAALRIGSAGDAISPRWMERVLPHLSTRIELPDKTAAEGLLDHPYAIAHQRIAHLATHSGVPIGFWRSVGHSHNAFFIESFVDELAHAARADPLAYRLALLDPVLPRHAAVLRLAAERAGWGQVLPAGVARGLALHESFGSIVAQVLELRRDAQGQPRVQRVVCALDCGQVVNPAIVERQMEGAIVFGLTAALWGRIDIGADGAVRQQNFHDQPLLTLAQTPRIETYLVASSNPPGGVGEPGVPPVAPALANAWFALSGERRRRLPLWGASA